MSEDLEKLKGEKHIPLGENLKRVFKYMRPELPRIILAMFLIIVNVGLDIVMPLFVSEITNNLKSLDINLRFIIGLAVSYFAIALVNQIVLYIESMILQHIGQRVIYRLRVEVYEHIQNMSQNQFDEMPVGSLVTRVASYTASMSDLFTNVLIEVLRNVLTVVGVYAIMFYISWQLSLVMLAFIAVVFVTSMVFRKIVSKIFRAERGYIRDLNTLLNEN